MNKSNNLNKSIGHDENIDKAINKLRFSLEKLEMKASIISECITNFEEDAYSEIEDLSDSIEFLYHKHREKINHDCQ